jgi:peptidoglycan/LPS O-acetylase OafA/YrhL
MHARRWTPVLMRARFILVGGAAALFVLAALHYSGRIDFVLAKFLCPVPFVLCLPVIQRQAIPFARQFEEIGKHSYGVYLTHLLVLDLALWVISAAAPGLLSSPVPVVPALVALGLAIPLAVMDWAARLLTRRAYRYVFG